MAFVVRYIPSLSVVDCSIFVLVFCVIWFLFKIHISPRFSPLYKIPGYRGHWFTGIMMVGVENKSDRGLFILEQVQKLGSEVFRIHLPFGTPAIAIAGPQYYKHVTVTHNSNYPKPAMMYRAFADLVGNGGLVTLNGEEHAAQRFLCNGAFKPNMLKYMFDKIEQNSMELVRYWQDMTKGNCIPSQNPTNWIEIGEDLERSTLDTIVNIAFDYNASILRSPEGDVNQAIRGCINSFASTYVRYIPFYKYLPTRQNRAFNRNKRVLDSLVYEMISKKQEMMKDASDDFSTDNLLTMLILAEDPDGRKMTNDQLHDHVMTFMFAGAETTATTLSWCLYALACYQGIQDKVRDEVRRVAPDTSTPLTFGDIEQMAYLVCTIKETLRYHTPVPVTIRVASHDDVIDGYHIPTGTVMMLFASAIHLNPKYWKQPDKFIPERFLNVEGMEPCSFIPFTSGPRMCIGRKFAMMELKIYLAELVRCFKFELTPGMDKVGSVPGLTSHPDPHIVLKLIQI